MKRLLPALAVVAAMALPAPAWAQEESKPESILKKLTEKVQQLEQKVEELTRKLNEAKPAEKIEKLVDKLLEKVGGAEMDLEKFMEKAPKLEDLQKKLEEKLEGMMPELPGGVPFEDLPGMLESMDWDAMMEMMMERLQGQFGEFFDGFDAEKLFKELERKLKPQSPKPDESEEISYEI